MSSLEAVDAHADPPAIGLELGLAGAAGADAAAEPRQLGADADQARQQVLQLRQLDLQLAFAGARAAGEDVENQLRAIDDLARQPLARVRAAAPATARCRRRRRRRRLRRRPAPASSTLPLPRNVAGSGFGRSCRTRSTTRAPAASASPSSSSIERSASTRRVVARHQPHERRALGEVRPLLHAGLIVQDGSSAPARQDPDASARADGRLSPGDIHTQTMPPTGPAARRRRRTPRASPAR